MSSNHKLEPKYGWGHEQFKDELIAKIESLYIDASWRPQEVIRAVTKIIKEA